VQHADIPIKLTTLALHLVSVSDQLLLTSRPVKSRRLSWSERRVRFQLAEGCLHVANDPERFDRDLKVTSSILYRTVMGRNELIRKTKPNLKCVVALRAGAECSLSNF